jgi:ribosomal-protein-serine acetyltransferase
VEEIEGYSPGPGARLVFTKALREPVAGAGAEVDLGDGVRLRPMRLQDTDELHRVIEANGEHIGRWLPFSEQSQEETAGHVRRTVRSFETGDGLGMVVLEDGRLVGAVSFVEPSRAHRSTQIGYWLAQDAGGRGIMTGAVRAMVREAFGPWGFRRVEIRVAADNARSRAIPERLGFREEGVLREAHTVAGASHDEIVYGLLAGDEQTR